MEYKVPRILSYLGFKLDKAMQQSSEASKVPAVPKGPTLQLSTPHFPAI